MSKPEKVVVVGASGFGREGLDVLDAQIASGVQILVAGVLDDTHSAATVQRVPDLCGVFEDGVVICAGAAISTNVKRGRHVHVNGHATSGHHSPLRAFVSANPAAVISSEVPVEIGTHRGRSSRPSAAHRQGTNRDRCRRCGHEACVIRCGCEGCTGGVGVIGGRDGSSGRHRSRETSAAFTRGDSRRR